MFKLVGNYFVKGNYFTLVASKPPPTILMASDPHSSSVSAGDFFALSRADPDGSLGIPRYGL